MLMVLVLCAGLGSCAKDEKDLNQGSQEGQESGLPASITVYGNPCMQWGESQATVKSFMKDYTLLSEDDATLVFKKRYKELFTAYLFRTGRLIGANVSVLQSDVKQDDLLDKLRAEHYDYVGVRSDGATLFVDPNQVTMVILMKDTKNKAWSVYYYEYEFVMNNDVSGVTIYRNPCLDWGADKAAVKNYMSEYVLKSESETVLAYEGKHQESTIAYQFVHSRLSAVVVMLKKSVVTRDELRIKLEAEHYTYVNIIEGNMFFVSEDQTVAVVIGDDKDADTWNVNYTEFNPI